MNVAIGTVPRPSNPLGVLAPVCGIAGALVTGVLWLHQQRPHSPLLGGYGYEIAYGGQLREDLILLAALFGAVAIGAAILSTLGGPAKASAIAAVLLGAVALSYPVLAWMETVETPLRVALFPGS